MIRETIIRLNTAFDIENTWTEITDINDIAILEHSYSFEEQAKVSLVVGQLTTDGKNQWGTKMFAFGGFANQRDKHLRSIRYDYFSANNTASMVIQFWKENDVWGYVRRRHYW